MVLEGIRDCAGVAVEFDKIATLGVFPQLEGVDDGLCVDGLVGDGVALESGRERGRVGRYCGRHFGCRSCRGRDLGLFKRLQVRVSWSFYIPKWIAWAAYGARACVV